MADKQSGTAVRWMASCEQFGTAVTSMDGRGQGTKRTTDRLLNSNKATVIKQ